MINPFFTNNRWTLLTAAVWVLVTLLVLWQINKNHDRSSYNTPPLSDTVRSTLPNIPDFIPHTSYSIPSRLNYPYPDDGEELETMKDGFLPIGWSRDGKFAYATEPSDEACGCYFFKIFVQDMVTDEILWSWSYSSGVDESTQNTGTTLEQVWLKMQKEFSQKLNQYQIQTVRYDRVTKLPLQENGKLIKFDIRNRFGNLDQDYRVAYTKIYRTISGAPEKLLFSGNFGNSSDYLGVLSNGIAGCLRSPFENRVALLYFEKNWGYEGPPHVVSVHPIGADISLLQ